ncbi:MAG: DTW domain-containing protein [Deltaproteobacteria bacterium]|nr:MAG: DTW domain-containing protein [Deltaproteobacteria bacterium]
MRSQTPRDFTGLCRQCLMREDWCLCDRIPRVDTEMHIVIVRHFKEIYKTSNSARLASLALPNSTLLDFGVRGQTMDTSALEGEGVFLLFPTNDGTSGILNMGGEHPEAEEVDASADVAPHAAGTAVVPSKPKTLVVLDGSWRQARRMSRRITELRHLPRVSLLPASDDTERIRKPPHAWTMATLEAIARAVAMFEGDDKGEQLDQLFLDMVQHFRAMRRSLPLERYLEEVEQHASS